MYEDQQFSGQIDHSEQPTRQRNTSISLEERRAKDRERARKYRSSLSEEKKDQIREEQARKLQEKRKNMPEDKKIEIRLKNAERSRLRRARLKTIKELSGEEPKPKKRRVKVPKEDGELGYQNDGNYADYAALHGSAIHGLSELAQASHIAPAIQLYQANSDSEDEMKVVHTQPNHASIPVIDVIPIAPPVPIKAKAVRKRKVKEVAKEEGEI